MQDSPNARTEAKTMAVTRTHFTFRIDTWTADGESIVEHVAGIEDYQVAFATYQTSPTQPRGSHK